MKYLLSYLIIVNVIAFIFYFVDKKKAEKGKWRIKESTLLALSFIGGGVGSFIGMKLFRHKTQKLKFKIGVPVLFIISILMIYVLITAFNL